MSLKRRKDSQTGGSPKKKKAVKKAAPLKKQKANKAPLKKKEAPPKEIEYSDNSEEDLNDDDDLDFDLENGDDDDLGFENSGDYEFENTDEFGDSDGFEDGEEIPVDSANSQAAAKKGPKPKKEKNKQNEQPQEKVPKHLLKPPTSQELNALRETENLFHSNLFKLQVEEMLEEITMKKKRIDETNNWITKFENAVSNLAETEAYPVNDAPWLTKLKVKCPFECEYYEKTLTFRYVKPQKVIPVGSWAMGFFTKGTSVDILVEIPKESWNADDYLNYRYHRKRALYLAYIAGHLQSMPDLVKELHFEPFRGDLSRPILVVQPSGSLNHRVSFRIYACASPDFVGLERLLPDRNCVPGVSQGKKKADGQPTPLYNSGILADMRMAKVNQYAAETITPMKNVQDACVFLRVWLRHRQLDKAAGMFLLTQFVVHLIQSKKLFPNMSVYQTCRTIWVQFARLDLSNVGITLPQQSNNPPLSVADAHGSFEVVFLDVSSSVNFCAHLSKSTYEWLRWECILAVGLLSKKAINSFCSLFITPKPFLLSFDNVAILNDVRSAMLKDKRQPYLPVAAITEIVDCFTKGLGDRLKFAACHWMSVESWAVSEKPPQDNWKVAVGFCFQSPSVWEVMNKGPEADNSDASKFREFWGEKSELRRFQDGSICEAVHWPARNWAERRLVCRQIVTYLAEKKLKLGKKNITYVADQLDTVLTIGRLKNPEAYGTGEEATLLALEVLDELKGHLRTIEDLPLPVAQVQGVAATFRHAETFPPIPQLTYTKAKLLKRNKERLIPTVETTPMHLPSLTVLLSLQTSAKWPEDIEAIRRVKAAFYIHLGNKLSTLFSYIVKPAVDHLIVVRKRFVLKLVIAYQRDVALLKRIVEPSGMVRMRDNPESLMLERDQEITPQLTTVLRALQANQPAFSSAVRMAKRWVSSQMLLDYMAEEVIEMIVASLFVDSSSYGIPSTSKLQPQSSPANAIDWVGPLTPQVGFLRFLQLVACYDWNTQPLIINFNDELSPEELRGVDSAVTAQRTELISPVVLVTPYDPSGVAYTRTGPPVPVWSRLMLLAQESLKLLERQLMSNEDVVDVCQVFRPPMDSYDCVIHLSRANIARRMYTLDHTWLTKVTLEDKKDGTDNVDSFKLMPVYDYEPVDLLLKDLRAAYADKARFFYDKYGGTQIGVMWIDKAWSTPVEFKVSHVNGCTLVAPATTDGESRLAPNLEAICQDFLIMGKGLVKSVKTATREWTDV